VKARVAVRLKGAILDPQGKTVHQALLQLGYGEVSGVRIGKLIELELDGADRPALQSRVEEMSRRLLSNPLVEDFEIQFADEHGV